jgi:hypothetical protein
MLPDLKRLEAFHWINAFKRLEKQDSLIAKRHFEGGRWEKTFNIISNTVKLFLLMNMVVFFNVLIMAVHIVRCTEILIDYLN